MDATIQAPSQAHPGTPFLNNFIMELSEINRPVCVTPPRAVIDLSLPPKERYKILAQRWATQLRSLTGLYDNLLLDAGIPPWLVKRVHTLSWLFLRRVYDSEETQELQGISEVSGVPMYLLVAFNVILDLLMGCTSGGVLSQEDGQSQASARMLHFRTLDWTMDPLREVVIQLDFVRSQSPHPDAIIASSITYVGFVGVLTGVKRGLSLSLNFRAVHNAITKAEQFRFYLHHLLVLFGRRPSIASLLRQHLTGNDRNMQSERFCLERVVTDISRQHTTAAYLIFSDGQQTITMEKDYSTAMVDQSDTFIVRTNHDVDDHKATVKPVPTVTTNDNNMTRAVGGLEELLFESRERFDCIKQQFEKRTKQARAIQRPSTRTLRSAKAKEEEVNLHPTRAEIIQWLCTWTTTNECTHYAVIMDPQVGEVVWCRAYPEPLTEPYRGTTEWLAFGPRNRKRQWVSLAAGDATVGN